MSLRGLLLSAVLGLSYAQKGPNYPANKFDQIIDHFPDSPRYEPHTNDTFQQRYYFDSTYYKKGGPVYLYIGGETSGPSRFENLQNGIIQILMKKTNGLGVILENRYYGHSHPFENSTIDNLAYLTTEQTIADNANFALNVKFNGIDEDLTAPNTPWIMYGGSLAGAQTAFTVKTYPNVMWGGIASSGVIQAKLAYPQWYKPIQKFAPQDCVSTINNLVDQMDALFASGNREGITQLKTIFGLQAVEDDRDFARAISNPIGNPMFYPNPTWQELNWYSGYTSNDFWHFCSTLTDVNPPANNTAADTMLSQYSEGATWTGLGNYAAHVKKAILPYCTTGDYNSPGAGCFGTQDPAYWAHTRNSGIRSYLYTSCSEQGAYMAAPHEGPSLISRIIDVNYTQQWCEWAFKPGKYNSIPATPALDFYNKYGGYNFSAPRLAFIDGRIDPWLDVCYHSPQAPRRTSSPDHPELLIAGAGHHWDSYGIGNISAEPDFIKQAHKFEIRTVRRWLQEFNAQ